MKLRSAGTVVAMMLVVLSLIAAQVGSPVFMETFDGAPSAPTQFSSPRWDVAIHARDGLKGGTADHGTDCAGPPATHTMLPDGARVFQCRDHVMTWADGDGYAVTYLTPDAMVDFSQGEAVIRFDMSTLRTSERDWVDVWITPFEDQLVLPLNPGFPDLQGPPRRSVQIKLTDSSGFCPAVWVDGTEVEDSQAPWRCNDISYENAPGFPGTSASRRDTFEIRVSRTTLKIGMPAYNFWWYDETLRQPLDFTRGVVQFGHHSYNPTKGFQYGSPTGPNTWHWDNVSISPAAPFTIIPVVNGFMAQPAPAGSYARFAAWGENVQISVDGGSTWETARKPAQDNDCCHIFSYLHPIPAGTTTVLLRGQTQGGALPFRVEHLSVFTTGAPTGTGGPGGATTPSATATPTTTPSPTTTPTMTPTMTPTTAPSPTPPMTSTPTATSTPTPPTSPTPEPTATASPIPQPPRCEVWGRIDGGSERWFVVDCSLLLPTQ